MKHFKKKNEQKTSADSPFENFIIIYTEINQNENNSEKVMICMILSAISREKRCLRRQLIIRPPSKVAIGRRLNMLRASDMIEKFISDFDWWVTIKDKMPKSGPANAIAISFA